MRKTITLFIALAAIVPLLRAEDAEPDYTGGVFILNEDWYGHNNSTINYLTPDGEWEYRVFQKENPGKEIGGSAQFAAVFDGRMYIISKQDKDPAAAVVGGRITVCDARTMECIAQIPVIAQDSAGKSVADGRAFVGITPEKGYVSTSNGIYSFDLERLEVGGMIPGTGGGNSLYSGQCGMMVCPGDDYVYAVHQQKGLFVIDAETDTIVRTIAAPVDSVGGKAKQRGFGALVQSKDGDLWLSVSADVSGTGSTVDYIMRYDMELQDTVRVAVPEGFGAPSSWYAWTADAMCASSVENRLYWKKQDAGWFTNSVICCYDIDKGEFNPEFFDTQSIGWYLYCGAAFRLHPVTDEMYCTLYQGTLSQSYLTLRLSNRGEVLDSYEMIDNYWFPAMPVFPESDNGDATAVGVVDYAPDASVFYDPDARVLRICSDAMADITVCSMTGAVLWREVAVQGGTCISVSGWADGVYLVRVNGLVHKVIIH